MAEQGFTLLELVVALALLAVLSLLAAPSFGDYLRDCRRTAAIDLVMHSVHAARRLAASHGVTAELCPTRDGQACAAGSNWGSALLLQQRPPTAGAFPARIIQLPSGEPRLAVHANRDSLTFAPLLPAASAATVTVCDDRGATAAAAVIVSRNGRPRVSDRDASGRLLQCP